MHRRAPALRERDGNLCAPCGEPLGDAMHVDHRVPVGAWPEGEPGCHDDANLQLAHPACNLAKGDKLEHGGARLAEVVNTGRCMDCGASLGARGLAAARCKPCAEANHPSRRTQARGKRWRGLMRHRRDALAALAKVDKCAERVRRRLTASLAPHNPPSIERRRQGFGTYRCAGCGVALKHGNAKRCAPCKKSWDAAASATRWRRLRDAGELPERERIPYGRHCAVRPCAGCGRLVGKARKWCADCSPRGQLAKRNERRRRRDAMIRKLLAEGRSPASIAKLTGEHRKTVERLRRRHTGAQSSTKRR